jgi:hypothetical protein
VDKDDASGETKELEGRGIKGQMLAVILCCEFGPRARADREAFSICS